MFFINANKTNARLQVFEAYNTGKHKIEILGIKSLSEIYDKSLNLIRNGSKVFVDNKITINKYLDLGIGSLYIQDKFVEIYCNGYYYKIQTYTNTMLVGVYYYEDYNESVGDDIICLELGDLSMTTSIMFHLPVNPVGLLPYLQNQSVECRPMNKATFKRMCLMRGNGDKV